MADYQDLDVNYGQRRSPTQQASHPVRKIENLSFTCTPQHGYRVDFCSASSVFHA